MTLLTKLLPHQGAAVEKVGHLRVGALFMEMGTGKSRTAIEVAARRAGKIDRVVWFCPVSLKLPIALEIRKHVENPSIYVFDDRTSEARIPADAFWLVVGIESMSSSDRVILSAASLINDRSMVILDESSYIKGHKSRRTHWITQASKPARYRMILTGTPMSQGVVDLYSQLRFLDERILGYKSFYSFAANHLEYSEKRPGLIIRSHNLDYLAAKIAPYTYQVKKEECLSLPEKCGTVVGVGLTGEQRKEYDAAKERFYEDVLLLESERRENSYAMAILIFRLFSHLQRIVCGYAPSGTRLATNRLDALLNAAASIPGGEKVIIWTKYRDCLRDLCEAIAGRGQVAQFHGGLSEKERAAAVEQFRGPARFFVATTQAGGHGLTLTEAHHVIFHDNEFKYSSRLQAEDRCHRIGQTQKVTYIDLAAYDSIDYRILDAIAAKGHAVRIFAEKVKKMRDKKSLKEALNSL